MHQRRYDAEYVLQDVTALNARKRGVWASSNVDVVMFDSDVLDNGGTIDSTYAYYGGVATGEIESRDYPIFDSGTSTEDGDNLVCCNVDPDDTTLNYDEVDGDIRLFGNLSCTGVCD